MPGEPENRVLIPSFRLPRSSLRRTVKRQQTPNASVANRLWHAVPCRGGPKKGTGALLASDDFAPALVLTLGPTKYFTP